MTSWKAASARNALSSGGKGNDRIPYIVDDTLYTITEAASESDDLVVSTRQLHPERKCGTTLPGCRKHRRTANALNNRIDGTGEINKLDGGASNDLLFGNALMHA